VVYDPAGTSWILQYLALLFVAALVVLGVVVHRLLRCGSAPAALAGVVAGTAAEA
jgi:hypothetical protein